ncbi:zinc finger CCCH domain-containing protein 15-like [Coffea arabica]|uniref:Zinc finger CCCH domain-containing protein 15-like n=1 Tax=Coffea arabica TaxID=13443 RepID=A0A6P6V0U1_COFAR|nr:zinc finger CCCH domain-containing protein 15-like [Coffea arabica]
MEMEKEISKTGQRGGRTARNDVSFNNIPLPPASPPLPFVNYPGDIGLAPYRLSELEIRMMMSRLRHSDMLTDLHHHQELIDRQYTVLSYMEETAKEAQALRQENISLKMINAELTNRLSVLLRATSEYAASVELSGLGLGPGSDMSSVLHGLDKMNLGDGANEDRRNRGDDVEGAGEDTSQDTTVDTDLAEGSENDEVNRVSLPKSISVRSDRKLKTVQTGGSSEGQIYKQRVYVPGREKEKQAVELEVYNQGMFKTELCNKWQETGECPYGENCQFAHGIKELRPVLRHPRYKTEVCRMVLNGDHCPYGHRCHFRHTLTDEEKLIRSMNIRPLKPLNR